MLLLSWACEWWDEGKNSLLRSASGAGRGLPSPLSSSVQTFLGSFWSSLLSSKSMYWLLQKAHTGFL